MLTPCPFVDPESTASIKTPISANQWVDRDINRYEKYEISFEHELTQGRLDIYYFNSEGYGFRIKQIATYTTSPYKTTVMICLLYTSPSPRDGLLSRMPSSA